MFQPQPREYSKGETRRHRVAVLIPCLNEEQTIAEVVRQFRAELPGAVVYVCDNGSSDRTAERACEAGAEVIVERRRGKGRAVRRLFSNAEADVYLMVDGDGTYPAEAVRGLLRPVLDGRVDMTVGSRWHERSGSRSKAINLWGNRLLRFATNLIFDSSLTDVLSGYRAFSKEFVERARVSSTGFEVEVELTVKAIRRGGRVVEVPVELRPRPRGSRSKIRLWRDGVAIMVKLLVMSYGHKPSRLSGGGSRPEGNEPYVATTR